VTGDVVEFFIPWTRTPEHAESVWGGTRRLVQENLGFEISERRIFRLRYVHEGETLTAEVGQEEPGATGPVLMIFDSNPYLVCTPHRGVFSGTPIPVERESVVEIVEFDRNRQTRAGS
jgi:hypothetical protein